MTEQTTYVNKCIIRHDQELDTYYRPAATSDISTPPNTLQHSPTCGTTPPNIRHERNGIATEL